MGWLAGAECGMLQRNVPRGNSVTNNFHAN
jgi:hypothetical protein